MVTWGANTVHTLGTPAPAPGGFGTPAANPAAPSLFGSPAPAFGAAPAAGGFGGFGAGTTTPPASGGVGLGGSNIFGSTAGATPGAFGGTTTPAFGLSSTAGSTPAGTSLFGAAAPSSSSIFGASPAAPSAFGGFGSPAPSAFGATPQQQQQQQQPQIPAQAAMHAYMEGLNRSETEKIKAQLSKFYSTYTGSMAPTEGKKSTFVSTVYNDLTSEHRQQMWLQGVAPGGQVMPIAPPRPPQVSEEEWHKAVVQNPDPMSYMPCPLVGADALNARVTWQQERAKQLAENAVMVQNSHETVQLLYAQGRDRLEDIKRTHATHRKRLLNVMRKVEVVRCMNQPLQQDEVRARDQLHELDHKVRVVRQLMAELENRARAARPEHHRHRGAAAANHMTETELPDREQLTKVLNEHHEGLGQLTVQMSKDIRDVDLMKERVVPAYNHRR